MKNATRKWWLAAVLICCLCPAGFGHDKDKCKDHHNAKDNAKGCKPSSVPEGGSSAIYLLGAGLICTGAMFLRSRAVKPS
jgi:hypothetical protein